VTYCRMAMMSVACNNARGEGSSPLFEVFGTKLLGSHSYGATSNHLAALGVARTELLDHDIERGPIFPVTPERALHIEGRCSKRDRQFGG
jgi:hypothetical protein